MVTGEGKRRATYYALRLAIRALAGAKPTFKATANAPDLMAIATKERDGRINLLVLNWSDKVSYQITADLSGLLTNGAATLRQFSAGVHDEMVGKPAITKGILTLTAPPWSAVLATSGSPHGRHAAVSDRQ